ncbi:hypothetical protein JCM3775_000405 [Rhodotorula graminis]|uniref:Proteasome assembly chaperone 3 n=1 Tax=Rhodotorula graminis (strain WP1) TaxID=578459 RepID=A0A194S9N2_RHOGW|nr:uncharacterized protein RHOBADRAFT_51293 [Rhodotorula graminis WP1]KPV77438.1 hypothetical protein RHOBADRAFT_51293 [Rhodotorula graminis WP1]
MSALVDTANLDLASTPNQQPPLDPSASAPPPRAQPPPQAIPTAQRARKVNGIHTDVVVQIFQDRVLVIVTQLGRIGAMIQVTAPPSALTALPPPPPPPQASSSTARTVPRPAPHPSTLLTPLFGAAPSPHIASLHDLYALHVGAAIFARLGAAGEGAQRPVVLGIGLKRAQRDGAALGDDDDDAGVTEAEKETFEQVLDMVIECLG